MAFGDLSRVNTNLQSLQAFNQLQSTNEMLGARQLRLATGKRINRAEDDSAGFSIAKKLESKARGQAQALANIGDAKSMLTVAEGGLNTTMEILQTMKEKAVQAANDTLGTSERNSIKNQLDALSSEVDDIATNTEFNGVNLLDGSAGTIQMQVGAASADTFDVTSLQSAASADALGVGTGSLVVSSAASASATIQAIDDAINTVSSTLAGVGNDQKRLSFKQDNLATSINNTEAARSRIEDADFAKEQMEIVKLQILQQTGTAALAQANAAPQSVLSLF